MPAGLAVSVDGVNYTAPQTFNWTAGTSHTITVNAQLGARAARSVFTSWSDSGAISHMITSPSSSATYTASFGTQYPLELVASPGAGGTVTATPSSSDGYYNAGSSVQLSVLPASGFQFAGWTGDVSGMASMPTVSMTVAKSVTQQTSR